MVGALIDIDKFGAEFARLTMARQDIEQALRSLKVSKRYKKRDVVFPLLSDAIIAYSRPFTTSIQESGGKKTLLRRRAVPELFRKLHDQIIRHRNQIIAHTDMNYKRPRVGGPNSPLPLSVAFRAPPYEDWYAQRSEFEKLFTAVLDEVNARQASLADKLHSLFQESTER